MRIPDAILRAIPASLVLALCGWPACAQTIWSGTSGDFSIQWTSKNISVTRAGNPTEPVLSLDRVAAAEWRTVTTHAEGRPLSGQFSYRVLSLVGPYLSVEEAFYCDCGGAHPTATKGIRAIDLRTSKPDQPAPLSVTDILPAPEVFSRLASDRMVKAALQNSADPAPKSLTGLLKALQFQSVQSGECSYTFEPDLLRNFAFYNLRAQGVVVRFGLSAAEVCRGQMTEVGIVVPVPESLKSAVDMAKNRKAGLLAVDAPKAAMTVSFSFRPH